MTTLFEASATQRLNALIDDLSEADVFAVTRYVLFLRSVDDRLSMSLAEAPLSDEEYILDDDDEPSRVYTKRR